MPLVTMLFRRNPIPRLARLLPLALVAACSSVSGPYVWVSSYRDQPPSADQIIAVGDFVSVRVREDDKLTSRVRVRDDGKISLPLVDEVEVLGLTPTRVARRVEDRLKADHLFTTPHVSVTVEDSPSISVLGAVLRPGTYPLTPGSGVAEALASAGSLTEFAHRDRIFVVRRAPQPVRIRFTYRGLTGEDPSAIAFRLRAGDVVVVQ